MEGGSALKVEVEPTHLVLPAEVTTIRLKPMHLALNAHGPVQVLIECASYLDMLCLSSWEAMRHESLLTCKTGQALQYLPHILVRAAALVCRYGSCKVRVRYE